MLTSIFYMLLFSTASAQDRCSINNYAELVACVEQSSIKKQTTQYKLDASEASVRIADQWVNPELQLEKVSKGSEKSETSAALLFTLRLGGRKAALVNESEALYGKEKMLTQLDYQKFRLDLMLNLHRLGQLTREIAIEEETVKTFKKVIGQYKRPKLSPENEVSQSVFRLAVSDHEMKLDKLRVDLKEMYAKVSLMTGITENSIAKYLPTLKTSWPQYKESSADKISPEIKLAELDLKLAESQLDKAQAEAWPELKFGPAFKQVQELDVKEDFVGATVSFPIPVFNLNGNAKAAERNRVAAAKLEYQNAKMSATQNKSNLKLKYTTLVNSLTNNFSKNEVHNTHQNMERLFFNGLVSSALIIEAHRQLIEFEERKNQIELEALEAFGTLLILDEKFDGVIL